MFIMVFMDGIPSFAGRNPAFFPPNSDGHMTLVTMSNSAVKSCPNPSRIPHKSHKSSGEFRNCDARTHTLWLFNIAIENGDL
jgi:hypothetical protein